MNVKQIKEGSYRYKRPNWESWTSVTVEKIDGELVVRFVANRYPARPARLQDIPANAIFEYNDC